MSADIGCVLFMIMKLVKVLVMAEAGGWGMENLLSPLRAGS